MITDFADRHPAVTAWIIAALFTVLPASFMFLVDWLSDGEVNTALICLFYAFAVQLVLWLTVRRPILVVMPFLIIVIGFVVSEILYTVAISMQTPGAGVGRVVLSLCSAIVTVFGAEAVGVLVAPFVFGLICIVKKICECIRYR